METTAQAAAMQTHSALRRLNSRFADFLISAAVLCISPIAILAQPSAPVFSVPSGVYATMQTVSITDATAGAKIYYTTNGTAPTLMSTPYTGPISVSASE